MNDYTLFGSRWRRNKNRRPEARKIEPTSIVLRSSFYRRLHWPYTVKLRWLNSLVQWWNSSDKTQIIPKQCYIVLGVAGAGMQVRSQVKVRFSALSSPVHHNRWSISIWRQCRTRRKLYRDRNGVSCHPIRIPYMRPCNLADGDFQLATKAVALGLAFERFNKPSPWSSNNQDSSLTPRFSYEESRWQQT